ncbi:hypothetical protein DYB32_008866 [Aphanomyces invadans]|nr:hypothetical protein DYB32_008866 [Aphanomyces invadans]
MYHGNAQTPMARVNRKQSAVPMLEPTYRGRGDDEDGYDNHDRYSFESDDMNIRHTAPGDKIRSQGGRHENWATGMTSHKRKVSVADSEGDIGDARMSYASTAMFERDSTATSRYSNSFTGGPPPMVPGQPSRLPVRDSYEL